MAATLVASPPDEAAEHVFEVKYDGIRALAAVSGGHVAMWTRNALDLAGRCPEIASALAGLDVDEAVLDGEVVALDEQGVSRFQLLPGVEHVQVLFVFDLLWHDGEDLRPSPLDRRRALLERALAAPPPGVRRAARHGEDPTRPAHTSPGAAALAEAAARGFEGILAKRRGSPYVGKRSRDWLKIKLDLGQELAVVGYTESTVSSAQIGALLLGVVDGGELTYAGKVGTGFTVRMREELLRRLAPDRVDEPRVRRAPRMRDARWVEPRLVGEVRFTEWTGDGRLRHPTFRGLRPDKTPMECVRERPAPADATR